MSMQIAHRSPPGKAGRPVKVQVNAFELKRYPEGTVQHYDVNFPPYVLQDQRRTVMHLLLPKIFEGPNKNSPFAFDGKANLYILSNVELPVKTFNVDENESKGQPMNADPTKRKTVPVKIAHAASINLFELTELVSQRSKCSPFQAIAALNIVMKMAPVYDSGYPFKTSTFYVPPTKTGQNQSLPTSAILAGALEVFGGYFTSIRPGIGKVYFNIDRVTGAFVRSGNLVDVLMDFADTKKPADVNTNAPRLSSDKRIKYLRFLKGLIVTVTNRDPTQRFKIKAVSKESARSYMFESSQGHRESIQQCIETKYKIKLKYPDLQVVQITGTAWIPMEMCEVVTGKNFFGRLSPAQVAEMMKTRFTTLKPRDKRMAIEEGLRHVGLGSQRQKDWQIQVTPNFMEVNARQLNPPQLTYSNPQGGASTVAPRDGAWQIRGKQASVKTEVDRWIVVVFASDGRPQAPSWDGFSLKDVQDCVTQFIQGCATLGINFKNQRPTILHAGNVLHVRQNIVAASKKAGYASNNPPQFVLTFCLQGSYQYEHIKRVCDVELGVASQNLVIQKAQKARRAGGDYWNNVSLKVNVKLKGGINQSIAMAGFRTTPTIVFGADVYHPAPGSLLPSVAGVVASQDIAGVKYGALSRVQESRVEMITDLETMAHEHILTFYRLTKKKPDRILFYRDGVSEGQFEQVYEEEVSALRAACLKIAPDYKPKITYIICAKRHNIRFFPTNDADADRSGNSKAGTVIDTDIAHPVFDDWYLLSQAGLLGTSRPCHYTVLIDENNLGTDGIQMLTYQMAYLSPRSTRSLSIAAPANFAHLVCERARQHSSLGDTESAASSTSKKSDDEIRADLLTKTQLKHAQVHPNLRDTMYFM